MFIESSRLSVSSRAERKASSSTDRGKARGGDLKARRTEPKHSVSAIEATRKSREESVATRFRSTWMQNFRIGGGPPLWLILKGR
jgi:hypothetical protein